MIGTTPTPNSELDGLRLVGLGKISRCAGCPRYHSLVDAYLDGEGAEKSLAAPRTGCPHHYCKPLAKRYGKRATRAPFGSRLDSSS